MHILFSLLTGVLYAFAHPNFLGTGFLPLSPLAFIILIALLDRAATTRTRLLLVLAHQVGFQVTGFYWVPATLEEFGGLPPGVSHFLGLFLSPVLNPALWGYVAWLHWRHRVPGFSRWNMQLTTFVAAVLMTSLEILIPQQFPVYAGHVWMHLSTWLGLASVGGVSLYSFFTWWPIFSLVPLCRRQRPEWIGVSAVVVFALANLPGALRTQAEMQALRREGKQVKALNVRVVQANVGNFLKVESEAGDPLAVSDVIDRYKELTLLESPQTLDLVIWPETAYPFSFVSKDLKQGAEAIPDLFIDLLARTGAEILIGGYDNEGSDESERWRERFETEYNSALHFGIDGSLKQVYHKHILIPFGETLPFGPLNHALSKVLPAVSFFARGHEFPRFTTKSGASFVTPICYEILQGDFIKDMLNGAGGDVDFLVNLTNDSWYGRTAEPFQHLYLAKWRALEFQRPIVRSTNTGITTVIFPDGQEGRRLLTNEKDVLDFRLTLPQTAPLTIFQRYGQWPLVGLWALLSVLLSFQWWRQSRRGTGRAA